MTADDDADFRGSSSGQTNPRQSGF